MSTLRTDYKDDVLDATENIHRIYKQVDVGDDEFYLEDRTIYSQVGDSFGAADINATNTEVNALKATSTTMGNPVKVAYGGTGATTAANARTNLGVPPTSHASSATTYGVGNEGNYGHLKLSNSVSSTSGVNNGVAATPYAVKAAKDTADTAQTAANTAKNTADTAQTAAISAKNTADTAQTAAISAKNTAEAALAAAISAKDTAEAAMPKSGGRFTGFITPDGASKYSCGAHDCYWAEVYSDTGYFHTIRNFATGPASNWRYLNIYCPDNNGEGVVQIVRNDTPVFGAINASGFNVTSSIKYKKNVEDMTDEDAYKLLDFRPVTFDYKEELQGVGCKGLIAEEVAEIDTFGVTYNEDNEIFGLDYSKFIPQLIKLCQIQQKEIDELKKKIGS